MTQNFNELKKYHAINEIVNDIYDHFHAEDNLDLVAINNIFMEVLSKKFTIREVSKILVIPENDLRSIYGRFFFRKI